jgi:hypothetical protein
MEMKVDEASSLIVEAEVVFDRGIGSQRRRRETLEPALGQNVLQIRDASPIDQNVQIREAIKGRAQVLVALPVTIRNVRAVQSAEQVADNAKASRRDLWSHVLAPDLLRYL